MLARNAALVAWLRLPLREAVAASCRALAVCAKEGAWMRDMARLMADTAWALPRRHVVDAMVLDMRRKVREAEAAAVSVKSIAPGPQPDPESGAYTARAR